MNAAAMVAMAERDEVVGVVGAILRTEDDVVRFQTTTGGTARRLTPPLVALENLPFRGPAAWIDPFPFFDRPAYEKERRGPGGERAVKELNSPNRCGPLFNKNVRRPEGNSRACMRVVGVAWGQHWQCFRFGGEKGG